MKTFLLLLGLCCAALPVYAQSETTSTNPGYETHIRKTAEPIRIDGILSEAAWENAGAANHFQYQFPVDTGFSQWPTEIRLTFDEHNLYIAAICHQRQEDYTIQSLKRDFLAGTNDVINVIIDPSKDGLNGFLFGVSPYNVQREALIDNGYNQSFEWDNRWTSAVHNEPDQWVVEMAIPFKTLRYSVGEGINTWRLNFIRTKLKDWEVSTWYPVPRQYAPINLAFAGALIWDEAPPKPGKNVSLIPYAIAGYSVDYPRDTSTFEVTVKPKDWTANAGGDAKIAITPALNLDLTINPDFSQVEVDKQVANLSRFELFFPERRQFFLENRDLFALFGFPDTRPFFSRRIGLAFNPVRGNVEKVPILAGARLSGKLNDKWRVGLLDMQTQRVDWDSTHTLPAANFLVATTQRKVGARSAIGAIFVNKENFLDPLNEGQKGAAQPWNRVAGLEYNLYSKDNRWEGEWYYHRSFSPDPKRRGQTAASFLAFNDRNFNAKFGYLMSDSFYTAEAGFVPRNGRQSMYPGIGFSFYPKNSRLNSWSFGFEGTLDYAIYVPEGARFFKSTDRDLALYIQGEFKDQTLLNFVVFNDYTFLFQDFDPTNQHEPGTLPLPGNRGYNYSGMRFRFTSSNTYDLRGNVDLRVMEFFNGNLVSADGEIGYRIQPFGTVAVSYSFNRIRLPEPYASADFLLLGPRIEWSFARSLFASAFFQYNTQENNFNVNARLQWRYAPVSDVFLVYTDNSYAERLEGTPIRIFSPKNKALVLKVVYWLNL